MYGSRVTRALKYLRVTMRGHWGLSQTLLHGLTVGWSATDRLIT